MMDSLVIPVVRTSTGKASKLALEVCERGPGERSATHTVAFVSMLLRLLKYKLDFNEAVGM